MLYRTPSHLLAAAPRVLQAKGCVNVIGLAKFKAEAGARWNRIREGVYARLEGLLRGTLGPADLFARIDDDSYLVVMPTSEPEDVNLICLRVAYDLHISFLGQCELGHIEVSTAGPSPNEDELLLQILQPEKIQTLAEKVGIQFRSDPVPDPEPRSLSLAALEKQARERSAQGQPVVSAPVRLAIKNHFIPIWSVHNSAITTYMCEAKSITIAPRTDSVPFHVLAPGEQLQVQMCSFHTGTAQLHKSLRAKKQFLLAIPVPFEILGAPVGRKEIISACHDLPHELRPYLAFTIHDVPYGVAQTRLANMVTLLHPFSRTVSATIAPRSRVLSGYQGIGLNAIGYSLREFGQATAPTQQEIEELALFARRNGLRTFLSDVQKVSTLKHAQDAGIHHLSGTAIAPACDEPHGMWRLTWDKLTSQSMVELWV